MVNNKKTTAGFPAAVIIMLVNDELLKILAQMLRIDVILDHKLKLRFNCAQHQAEERLGIGISGFTMYPDIKRVFFRNLVQLLSIFRRGDFDIKRHINIPFLT